MMDARISVYDVELPLDTTLIDMGSDNE